MSVDTPLQPATSHFALTPCRTFPGSWVPATSMGAGSLTRPRARLTLGEGLEGPLPGKWFGMLELQSNAERRSISRMSVHVSLSLSMQAYACRCDCAGAKRQGHRRLGHPAGATTRALAGVPVFSLLAYPQISSRAVIKLLWTPVMNSLSMFMGFWPGRSVPHGAFLLLSKGDVFFEDICLRLPRLRRFYCRLFSSLELKGEPACGVPRSRPWSLPLGILGREQQ